ncbi:hypothetical protein GCM10009557_47790 [Virgisporangium ochraceum]|uniref:Uncharacterized protein n=1 Tax=Virgisporangium ochraceum TaxID=65505 RepID=A0A8J3ZQT0_9ACTN|nr:replication-relaxation family protein [Virgisporangium ochraceum]GIJ68204.1 hypothetical protein Voc01_031210 [Virgisporangium ochraceum]
MTAPFFVEIDLSTEPLNRLTRKIKGYTDLGRIVGRAWPVLFTFESAVRERHFHEHLTAADIRWPVASTVRPRMVDHRVEGNMPGPAEAVWWPHRYQCGRVRLIDLDALAQDRPVHRRR